MKKQDVLQILREVERGSVSAEEAFTRLKLAPFEDIGFAKVDHHREMRQASPRSSTARARPRSR